MIKKVVWWGTCIPVPLVLTSRSPSRSLIALHQWESTRISRIWSSQLTGRLIYVDRLYDWYVSQSKLCLHSQMLDNPHLHLSRIDHFRHKKNHRLTMSIFKNDFTSVPCPLPTNGGRERGGEASLCPIIFLLIRIKIPNKLVAWISDPKWNSPIGSFPFHRAQKTREFQGPTPSHFPT